MNHDELDELLTRSLRPPSGSSPTSGHGGALGDIVRRGRTRRRRRNSVAAVFGAVALAVIGVGVVSGRGHDGGQRVIVGDPSVTDPSVTDASATDAPTSITATTVGIVASTTSAPVSVGSGALSFVAVRDTTFELWTAASRVRSLVPCPATGNGCTVPVVTVVGDNVWYVVSRGDGSTAVERVSVADDAAAQVVYEPASGARVRDVTVVSVDDVYVIESAGGATRGTLVRLHGGAREVIAADVAEVVATAGGRLAYVTPDDVVVRETLDGAMRTVRIGSMASGGALVSQLSWAPTSDALIFRAAGGSVTDRYLLDVAGATTLEVARPLGAAAACWISDSQLGALQPAAASNATTLAGTVIGIDPVTLDRTPFGSAQHRTTQIGCGPDGTVALVELATSSSTGDLVRLHADGSVERLGSGYTRVRSIR